MFSLSKILTSDAAVKGVFLVITWTPTTLPQAPSYHQLQISKMRLEATLEATRCILDVPQQFPNFMPTIQNECEPGSTTFSNTILSTYAALYQRTRLSSCFPFLSAELDAGPITMIMLAIPILDPFLCAYSFPYLSGSAPSNCSRNKVSRSSEQFVVHSTRKALFNKAVEYGFVFHSHCRLSSGSWIRCKFLVFFLLDMNDNYSISLLCRRTMDCCLFYKCWHPP